MPYLCAKDLVGQLKKYINYNHFNSKGFQKFTW